MNEAPVRVLSWNINGLRSVAKKGFLEWLALHPDAVIGVQEVRAEEAQLPDEVREPEGWFTHFHSAQKKGYSGVGLFSRHTPDRVERVLGIDDFDNEGRVQVAHFGELQIWNVYFPNGSGNNRDLSRIPYKLAFYDHLRTRLLPEVQNGGRILVMGDFNTAHAEIDLARPKDNVKTSGFRPEERDAFGLWLKDGWVDTFRAHHGDVEGRYSWWSQRQGIRARNVGWRIDYVLASPGAHEFVRDADIHGSVLGSDHCPISVDLDRAVFGPDFVFAG